MLKKTQPPNVTALLPKVQVDTFTKESLQKLLPVKVAISDELLDKINDITTNGDMAEYYKENLLTFSTVLSLPNVSMSAYINAVQFVSLVLNDHSYTKAWARVFPDRYQRLLDQGVPAKDIQGHVTGYRKTKIVTKIMEQALVPSYLYNMSLFQEAINTQASIMRDERALNKDRIAAADSVLKYTQIPEHLITNKQEIVDKGMSIIELLANSVNSLAEAQRDSIKSNTFTVRQIAESKIIEGDFTNARNS